MRSIQAWGRSAVVQGAAIAVLLVGLTAQWALADEAVAEPVAAAEQGQSFLGWLLDALGIFLLPQLAISIALVAIIVINLLAVSRKKFFGELWIESFEEQVRNRQLREAVESIKANDCVLSRTVQAGLSRLPDGYAEGVAGVQEAAEQEGMRFDHRLSYVAMIGNIATMVGLLGTVWGMTASFMVIGQTRTTPDPSELARGVSQALVTTVIGLTQAIPAVIFFTVLKNLVAERFAELGLLSDRLIRHFKNVTITRRDKPTRDLGTREGQGGLAVESARGGDGASSPGGKPVG